jgi:curved DNA-binding protein CbpA
MQNLYSVLGLSRHASSEEIKAAYWALVKRSHPDINAGDEQAERRTKEFNRAYETLSNPEERAAYDLELGRLRARARRGFWKAAATGAVTFILAAGIFCATMTSTQFAHFQRTARGEPAMSAGDASKETLAARPHPGDHVDVPVTGLVNSDSSNAASTPASTRTAPPGEPSKRRDGTAQALDEGASQQERGASQPATPVHAEPQGIEQANASPPEAGAKRPTPSRSTREEPQPTEQASPSAPEVGTKQPAPSTSTRAEPQPTEQANASPPGAGAKQPTPATPAMDEPRRARQAKASAPEIDAKQPVPASVPRIQKKSQRPLNIAETRRAPIPSKPRGSARGLVSNDAMAMRFPSADEPYVNVGARNR